MTTSLPEVSATGQAAVGAPRQPAPPRRRRRRRSLAPLWLLSPAGIVIAALTVAPILFLVFTSFTDYDQRSLFTGAFEGVGLGQYARIALDPDFWWAVVRTVLFTGALVVGSIGIGMGVAQLLTRLGTAMRYLVTVVLVFAWAMPTVASSLVWTWLFQPGYGVINWLLSQTHVVGDVTDLSWTQNPVLAFACIWFLVVWESVPFAALTLYAAQTQVPPEFYEAARLDGASEWRIYRSITVTALRPTLLLITILSIIWDFNIFNEVWLVSHGGPDGATSTLGVFTYKIAFVGFDIGQGAAVSVVTTVLLMIVTGFYIRNLIRAGEDL